MLRIARLVRNACAIKFVTLLSVCIVAFSHNQIGHAQVTDQQLDWGTKPYHGADISNIDSIDLASLNLTVRIPIVSYKQRGTLPDFGFSIISNSNMWTPFLNSGDNSYWWIRTSKAGIYPALLTNYTYDTKLTKLGEIPGSGQGVGGTTKTPVYYQTTMIADSTGGYHSVGTTETVDGSGLKWDPTGYGTITDRNGIKYNGSTANTTSNWLPASTQTDPSGNTITPTLVSGAPTSWTDSVGRSIPAPTWGNGCSTHNFPGLGSGTSTYIFCGSTHALTTNFNNPIVAHEGSASEVLLDSIELPDGSFWRFTYDSYGEITKIDLPTGGYISYVWATDFDTNNFSKRVVSSRSIYDGTNIRTTQYHLSVPTIANSPYGIGLIARVVRDAAGNDTLHQFGANNAELEVDYFQGHISTTSPPAYGGTCSGFISASNLLMSVQKTYQGTGDDVFGLAAQGTGALPMTETTMLANGQISQKTYSYDNSSTWSTAAIVAQEQILGYTGSAQNIAFSHGNVLTTSSYDYGSCAPGGLLQKSVTSYKWESNSSYLTSNLVDLPYIVNVYGPDGATSAAQTTYAYDETSYSPGGIRGSLTSVTKANNAGSNPVTHTVYNSQGMPTTTIDGNGNKTYVSAFQCSGLFPQTVISPYQSSTTTAETKSYTYDCDTGTLLSYTDQNSITTNYTYDDPLTRLTSIQAATGTLAESWTTYAYPDVQHINVTHDLNVKQDKLITSSSTLDGLGRVIQSTAPSGATVDTVYDPLGRVFTISNPYLSTSESTYGLTTYTYDALGRKTKQQHPDGGSQLWSYNGNVVTFTSESGSQWQRTTDGLARLTKVLEPSSTNASPILETDYAYDSLSNLETVTQLGAGADTARTVRTSHYDSLSRLASSFNPESGSTTYVYDADGNLTSKVDQAVNLTTGTKTTNYCYDNLNRVTVRYVYSGASGCGTPATLSSIDKSVFAYDGNQLSGSLITGVAFTNAIGLRTDAAHYLNNSIVSESVPYNFDPMGRVKTEQTMPLSSGSSYTLNHTYDLSGNLVTSMNSATGITITNAYDVASRLSSVSSDYTSYTYHLAYPPIVINYPSTLFSVSSYGPAGIVKASYAGATPTDDSTGFFNLFRYYNNRMRVVDNELYPSANAAFGTGTVAIIGQGATDSGVVKITAGSVTASASYSVGDSASTVAESLASYFNHSSGSAVTASVPVGSYNAKNSAGQIVCQDGVVPGTTTPCAVLSLQAIVVGQYGDVALANAAGSGGSFTTTTSNTTLIGGAGTPQGSNSAYVYSLTYSYAGDVVSANDPYNGSWAYSYDALDRLTGAAHSSYEGTGVVTPSGTFNYQCWAYDSFGNRTNELESNSTCPSTLTAGTSTHWTTFDASNRISGSDTGGVAYDASGNVTQDAINNYVYDAEGRLCAIQNRFTTSGIQYVYDAYGQRVAKGTIASWPTAGSRCAPPTAAAGFTLTSLKLRTDGTEDTEVFQTGSTGYSLGGWQQNVYESGSLLATYTQHNGALNGSAPSLYFNINDWQGTKRLQLDTNGAATAYWKSDPYGAYLTQVGSGADASENHFTGKERDTESGLDYFGARYYVSSMGRFLSPDWSDQIEAVPYGFLDDPQSLNLYAYVRDNPLFMIDPDGHGWWKDFANGLADTTYRPFVQIVTHPIATAEGLANAVAHPVTTVEGIGIAIKNTVVAAAHGDGRAIGQIVGTGITAIATSGTAGVIGKALSGASIGVDAGAFVTSSTTVETLEVNEGIYEFTAASGKTYVGQSGDINARIAQHIASGKLDPADLATLQKTEVLGGKTAREIAEQLRINQLGGIDKLENVRNPIGPARQYLMPTPPSQ